MADMRYTTQQVRDIVTDDERYPAAGEAFDAWLERVRVDAAVTALLDYADTFAYPTGGRATDVREYAERLAIRASEASS